MLDALIAGGGPAGATAALLLARAGKNVRIFERTVFPRTKACGEYLSAGAVRLLHELGVGEVLARVARPVHGVRLHGHGVQARIDFPKPGWSVPRSVLDETLLRAALDAGASLAHARVEECEDGAECGSVGFVSLPRGVMGQAEAEIVIAADGMHSIAARKCGLAGESASGSRFALGGHYRGFAGLDGYIDMFVQGRSYVAVNPLTDHSANVMLIVDRTELEEHRTDVEAFAYDRAQQLAGRLLAGTQVEGKRLAIGPLSYRARRLAGKHVLLVGDAARFIDPFTGQGVYLAMRCARIAADCIVSGDLRSYESRAWREISARERAARRVSQIIASPALSRVAGSVMRRNPWLLRPLVSRVTGAA